MGGASAQVAYEVPPTHVLSSANTDGDEFFTVQSVWGRRVYAGTLDGFGANEARRRYAESLYHEMCAPVASVLHVLHCVLFTTN